MANQMDELLKFREADAVINQIMDVFGEASEVHKQALIAMGQQPAVTNSPVASTDVVMNLNSDLSSRGITGNERRR